MTTMSAETTELSPKWTVQSEISLHRGYKLYVTGFLALWCTFHSTLPLTQQDISYSNAMLHQYLLNKFSAEI